MALREYARQLGDVERVAEEADRYISVHGSFSLHEGGLIGLLAGSHERLVGELHQLLAHLKKLGADSQASLRAAAERCETTDLQSAAEIDAEYPAVPRGLEFQD
ncbi:hypothetical protein AB0F81_43635 [Actinoplanes sp. NPDC024001]|uniref:hypothetical protein n=1 Tax=Actinoplanes sp. NPDC024001 TaxID=3154598 RepID=UPI0033F301A0